MNTPEIASVVDQPKMPAEPASRESGTLFLVPTPLGIGDDPLRVLPPSTVQAIHRIDYVIAENARSARAVLGKLGLLNPLQAIEIRELNLRTAPDQIPALLAPLRAGRDAALLSEAGCPAVADPGALLVELAHREHLRVAPLIGPSSILLALMASGMNGQRFAFAGYIPVPEDERTQRIRELEQRSAREDETQLLIETPYRNQSLLEALTRQLQDSTMLAIASDLSLPGECIDSRTIAGWRHRPPDLARVPTVFAFYAAGSLRARPPRQGRPANTSQQRSIRAKSKRR